jgi:hypothetical protein
MKAKGLNTADKVLAKGIGHSLIHSLTKQKLRNGLVTRGKHHGAYIWALPDTNRLL